MKLRSSGEKKGTKNVPKNGAISHALINLPLGLKWTVFTYY